MRVWQFLNNNAVDVFETEGSFALTMQPEEFPLHFDDEQVKKLKHWLETFDYLCFRKWNNEFIMFPVNDVDVCKKTMLDFATERAIERGLVEKSRMKPKVKQ
jgi:hypothetical protein